MFNRIVEKLRDRTGSSMLLVLAVTLLLLAIGGSALAAGSTAMGQVVAQRDAKQLDLYTYSINGSIMSALESTEDSSLGKDLAMQFYQHAVDGTASPLPKSLAVNITGYTLPANLVQNIRLYCYPDVRITPAVPRVTIPQLDAAGNVIPGAEEVLAERQNRTALVDATVEVVTTLTLGGRRISSAATYRLSDAALMDNGIDETIMTFTGLGRWEMTKYETIAEPTS